MCFLGVYEKIYQWNLIRTKTKRSIRQKNTEMATKTLTPEERKAFNQYLSQQKNKKKGYKPVDRTMDDVAATTGAISSRHSWWGCCDCSCDCDCCGDCADFCD